MPASECLKCKREMTPDNSYPYHKYCKECLFKNVKENRKRRRIQEAKRKEPQTCSICRHMPAYCLSTKKVSELTDEEFKAAKFLCLNCLIKQNSS
jgi:hypothetical protein